LNWPRCQAYYEVLNADAAFQAALYVLDDFVEPHCPLYPMNGHIAATVWPAVDAFVRQWRLPTKPAQFPDGLRGGQAYGFDDMQYRYSVRRAARLPGEFRRLLVGARPDPRSVLDEYSKPYIHEDGRVDADVTPPAIRPMLPEPFCYDPTALPGARGAMKPKELQRRASAVAAAVKADILAQAAAIEKRAERMGFAPRGSRYQDPGEIARGARRLYQRAVLRMKYADIAEAEPRGGADSVTEAAIRAAVNEWAKRLGVPLP